MRRGGSRSNLGVQDSQSNRVPHDASWREPIRSLSTECVVTLANGIPLLHGASLRRGLRVCHDRSWPFWS
jgi:hypothetical protein